MKRVSDARATKIRAELERLVERQIHERGADSLMDFRRKHQGELFPDPLCPFINMLCPNDLCYLPAGHVGTVEGFHITGTCAYDYATRWEDGDCLGPVSASRYTLVNLGAARARQMRLDEIDGVG